MKIYLFALMGILVFSSSASAQKANTDSLKLVAKISAQQFKLAKLQNSLGDKATHKQEAATQAQQSADANITAAEKLSNNPDDKKLARKAENKASDAKSDARKSRKETARLDNLNKDIHSLQWEIDGNQKKLNRYLPYGGSTPPIPAVPVKTDSIPKQ